MKFSSNPTRRLFALVAAAAVVAATTGTAHAQEGAKHAGAVSQAIEAKVGLDGYCAVCIIDSKKWAKGDPNINSTFDGFTYYFPNEAIKAKFDANPLKYVPALNGDCIVCYEKFGKRVPGSVQHAASRNNRLYLFPSDKEKQSFLANAAEYDDSDLAANGECIVCLAKVNKHVPGTAEHTVIHNGLRYQFPSPAEAQAFRNSPDTFIHQVSQLQASPQGKTARVENDANNGVRLVGRSGCAGCEFGVTPLQAPEELGLAIVGDDGRVTVLEGAHQNYPQIYKDRFQGQQLAVEGKIVKTQGKISWLEPTSLRVIN